MSQKQFYYNKLVLLCAVFMIMIVSTPAQIGGMMKQDITGFDVSLTKANLPPLVFDSIQTPHPAILVYFEYYHLNFPDVQHFFGTVPSDTNQIAAHIFLPDSTKGSVVLLHGYFDHAGIMKNLIECCLDLRLAVAIFDLPGHGLSTGERFSIGDFSDYVEALHDFIHMIKNQLPLPLHLIGQSTGGAIAFEYLHTSTDSPFEKVILIAPLVHHQQWRLSKLGYMLANPFVDSVQRKHRKNSSDPDYLERVKHDPLQARKKTPFGFIKAIYSWNDRIQHYDAVDQDVLIVQGDADVVVDWQYNVPFLQSKFTKTQIEMIDGGNHQLANESVELREQVFNYIRNFLEQTEIE